MRFRKQIGIAAAAVLAFAAALPVYAQEETSTVVATEPETVVEPAPFTEPAMPEGEGKTAPAVAYPLTEAQIKIVLPGEELEGKLTSFSLPDGDIVYGFSIAVPLEEDGAVTGTFSLDCEAFILSDKGDLYLLTSGAYDVMEDLFGKDGRDYMDALAVSTDCIRLPMCLPDKADGAWEKLMSSTSFLIPEEEGDHTAEGEAVFEILNEDAFNTAARALADCLSGMDPAGTAAAIDTICAQAGIRAGDIPLLSWMSDPSGALREFWEREEDGYGRRLAKMFREPYDNGADISLHRWRDTDGCGFEYDVQAPVNTEGIGAYSISFVKRYRAGTVSFPGDAVTEGAEGLTDVSARFFYILDMGRAEMQKAAAGEESTEEGSTEAE